MSDEIDEIKKAIRGGRGILTTFELVELHIDAGFETVKIPAPISLEDLERVAKRLAGEGFKSIEGDGEAFVFYKRAPDPWLEDAPTIAGYYWLARRETRFPTIVEVYQCDEVLRLRYAHYFADLENGMAVSETLGQFCWLGPIDEPAC